MLRAKLRFMLARLLVCLSLLLAACGNEQNDPYPASERGQNILYTAFLERPKHLDPVQSYSEDENTFIGQSPQDYTGFKLAVFEDELGTFTNDTEKVWEGKPHE